MKKAAQHRGQSPCAGFAAHGNSPQCALTLDGVWRARIPKGVLVRKCCGCRPANGLLWEKIDGGCRIAGTDITGTVMQKDAE